MRRAIVQLVFVFALGTAFLAQGAVAWNAPPEQQTKGAFWRIHWYERGIEHGNPAFDQRFRVNSPEAVLHPVFGRRVEARENGLMLILAEEDLSLLTGAELYLEAWGGHPGTANKRVTINGRSTYFLPRVGTEETNCAYFHPDLPLKISDLVNGYNACQFALDQGTTFWGHMIVDNACLRLCLAPTHPDLAAAGLDHFSAVLQAKKSTEGVEGFELKLLVPEADAAKIESVDFEGWYAGYDENGNGLGTDWHGFTKGRKPSAHLGTVAGGNPVLRWDVSMLPAQRGAAVRAIVHFNGLTNLVYSTAAFKAVEISHPSRIRVALFSPRDLPHAFWSRADRRLECAIPIDIDPSLIERAELHVNAWTGGAGTIADYFTLNGQFFPVAEGARHELVYSRMPVDPKLLRRGGNQIELLSNTEHHGIEILLPGPCLMVRYRERDSTSRL